MRRVPLKDFEGLYEICENGDIWSLPRRLTIKTPRLIAKNMAKNNYVYIALCKDGVECTRVLHRLLAIAFIPNPENKPCVNHKDGNKHNYRLENLEWVTHSENTRHAVKNGLRNTSKGENHCRAKITEALAREIKKDTRKVRAIAEAYGLGTSLVEGIRYGYTWKHVTA